MSKKSIGQVAKILDVPVHTVRFWTDSFIHIQKMCLIGNGGRRYYDENSINELTKLKDALYNNGLTIEGVKKIVKYNKINLSNDFNNVLDNNKECLNTESDVLKVKLLRVKIKGILEKIDNIRKVINS